MNALICEDAHTATYRWKGEMSMYGNDEKEENSNPKKYISCPHCGEQILMMPSLSLMIEAIENHLSTHRGNGEYPKVDPIQHPKAPSSISEDLAEQVLIRAAEIGESLSKEPAMTLNPLNK